MAALSDLAGLSPNCWAVRVQMEHWAFTLGVASPRQRTSANARIFLDVDVFAIWQKY
jgi:hypothetical protein